MESKTELTIGVDAFTLRDIFEKTAVYKGLKLQICVSKVCSEPIKVYELDDNLLVVLRQSGIKRRLRPDCQNEVFTLVDENFQEKDQEGLARINYWNFKLREFKLREGDRHNFDLRIPLIIDLSLDIEKRGIALHPRSPSPLLYPSSRLPNFRMFKALTESDKDAPLVAKELAASDGSIMVTWTEIGLAGIRKLEDIFVEFVGQNETVMQLGRDRKVFYPLPYPKSLLSHNDLFVVESVQPTIIETWRTQLNEYRNSLVL